MFRSIRVGLLLAEIVAALGFGALVSPAKAGTKTVTFGWEDGTTTASIDFNGDMVNDLPALAITPDSSSVTLANVTSGSQFDFQTSTTALVTPFVGSRMLEVVVVPNQQDNGADAAVYLGLLTGLDTGDTYSFKFRAHDPTDGRSPSNPPNASYANTSTLTTLGGFAVPLQTFITGSGWLDTFLDSDGNANTGANPVNTYNPSGANNAVRLHAEFFYQSASIATMAPEKFYIDSLEITVTSNNPDAKIFLPNGTSVLVNAGLAGDYNQNGKVDAADYVLWRKDPNSFGGDPGGYNTWRANFGNPPGSGAGDSLSAGAVPEPASIAIVLLGCAACGLICRGR